MDLILKEFVSLDEMLGEWETIVHLYPNLSKEKYASMLLEMIPNNYFQLAAFENDICLGICGFWIGTKLWCGKYIELDNVVVKQEYRSKGVGKWMTDYLEEKARQMGCSILVLDAYTHNFGAHRFYYNQGFGPKGFHFVKILEEDKLT